MEIIGILILFLTTYALANSLVEPVAAQMRKDNQPFVDVSKMIVCIFASSLITFFLPAVVMLSFNESVGRILELKPVSFPQAAWLVIFVRTLFNVWQTKVK